MSYKTAKIITVKEKIIARSRFREKINTAINRALTKLTTGQIDPTGVGTSKQRSRSADQVFKHVRRERDRSSPEPSDKRDPNHNLFGNERYILKELNMDEKNHTGQPIVGARDLAQAMQETGLGAPPISVLFSGAATQNIKNWLRTYDTNTTAMRWSERMKAEKLPMYLSGCAHSWFSTLSQDPVNDAALTGLKFKGSSSINTILLISKIICDEH